MHGDKTALDCPGPRAEESRGGGEGRTLDEGAHHRRGRHDRAQIDRAPRPRRKTRRPSAITHAHLVDIVAPQRRPDAPFPVAVDAFDIAAPYVAPKLVAPRPDIIFLLASVVSGEAEADFDKGYAINVGGTQSLFEAIRREQALAGGAYRPRLIFTSSIAVFGAPFPDKIGDEFLTAPLTSYGTQKAICELLLADYSRRGFFDGVGLRLPTICVRPGLPNKAASGFFSGIIREPLTGKEAILPVDDSVRHWHASPRAAVEFLLRAAELDLSAARLAPLAHAAGRERHRRRADRGSARHRRREDGRPHPTAARRDDRQDRRRLAAGFRSGAGEKPRISRRRQFFGYNQRLYRGRT